MELREVTTSTAHPDLSPARPCGLGLRLHPAPEVGRLPSLDPSRAAGSLSGIHADTWGEPLAL